MIKTLQIHHVRNLRNIKFDCKKINVFIGGNGSGKTSLLEAVFLLFRGKSFRHHQPRHYISHQQGDATVFAKLQNGQVAINKDQNAATILRYNGNNIKTQATITKILPLLLIDPSSMDILEEGSGTRRQLLDWLCFHQNGEFFGIWADYQKLLKQRNSLLKQKFFDRQQITAWDNLLSDKAAQLHQIREQVFDHWQRHFNDCITNLLPTYANDKFMLSYNAGFDVSMPLKHSLSARLEDDKAAGFTRIGAHRADISITLTNQKRHQAVNVLSRGEKKLLITALKLSQLTALGNLSSLVLIDDIGAELDESAIWRLLQTLTALPCQLFITSLNPNIITQLSHHNADDVAIFGVKSGVIDCSPKPYID